MWSDWIACFPHLNRIDGVCARGDRVGWLGCKTRILSRCDATDLHYSHRALYKADSIHQLLTTWLDSAEVLKLLQYCGGFSPRTKGRQRASTRQTNMKRISLKLFLISFLFLEGSTQDFGQTQFICTSVPKDMDLCTATMQNNGPAEDLKTTVMQLRETVLQQKETIMNQKETIRELTSKLIRCESQVGPDLGDSKAGGRRKETGSKNTMGDVSRGPTDTLAQLGQTLQTLKQRLENLEVCTYLPWRC